MRHLKLRHALAVFIVLSIMAAGWGSLGLLRSAAQTQSGKGLTIRQDERAGTISVFRAGQAAPILTQNAKPDARPYLHPIAAPDGKGVLTEFSPAHHKHQTGLYWGFTRVNGRDYFHNPDGKYWRRVSATVTQGRQQGRTTGRPMADGLRPARRGGHAVLTETAALVDARTERRLRARSRMARGSQDGRHDRQVRLRRAVPAHAVARGHRRRGRQRRAAAQRARRRAARHVDRRRDAGRGAQRPGARRDLRSSRPTPAIRRPGASMDSWASAPRDRATRDWTIAQGQTGSHPPSVPHLHRHAQRRRDDQRLERSSAATRRRPRCGRSRRRKDATRSS